MLFLQTLVFLLLGVFFLVRGLRGRYVGQEPRCKSCTYQLTGRLDAERCPECGTRLTQETIVYGLRKRRWVSLIAVAVVVGVFWAVPREILLDFQYINWYEYYPTKMLFRPAESGELQAILELDRRAMLGRSTHDAAELAMKQLNQWPPGPHDGRWSNLLYGLDRRRLLTDEQRDRLFAMLAQASLAVRPVIRQGDPLPLRVYYESSRAERHGYRLWHEMAEVRVGGQEAFRAPWNGWANRDPGWTRYTWTRSTWAPGERAVMTSAAVDAPIGVVNVEYTGHHAFLLPWFNASSGRYCWSPTPNPTWSEQVRLTGSVQILPTDAPDPVSWLTDPHARAQLQDTISVCMRAQSEDAIDGCVGGDCWVCSWESHVDETLVFPELEGNHEILNISVFLSDPSPIPIAFDLVVEADGSELETATDVDRNRPRWGVCSSPSVLAWNRGEWGAVYRVVRVPRFTADEVFVILRGSRDVARKTVDMYEVWQGKLRFGPFRVEHAAP